MLGTSPKLRITTASSSSPPAGSAVHGFEFVVHGEGAAYWSRVQISPLQIKPRSTQPSNLSSPADFMAIWARYRDPFRTSTTVPVQRAPSGAMSTSTCSPRSLPSSVQLKAPHRSGPQGFMAIRAVWSLTSQVPTGDEAGNGTVAATDAADEARTKANEGKRTRIPF